VFAIKAKFHNAIQIWLHCELV